MNHKSPPPPPLYGTPPHFPASQISSQISSLIKTSCASPLSFWWRTIKRPSFQLKLKNCFVSIDAVRFMTALLTTKKTRASREHVPFFYPLIGPKVSKKWAADKEAALQPSRAQFFFLAGPKELFRLNVCLLQLLVKVSSEPQPNTLNWC